MVHAAVITGAQKVRRANLADAQYRIRICATIIRWRHYGYLVYDVIKVTYVADDDWADHFPESSDDNDSRRHRRCTRQTQQFTETHLRHVTPHFYAKYKSLHGYKLCCTYPRDYYSVDNKGHELQNRICQVVILHDIGLSYIVTMS